MSFRELYREFAAARLRRMDEMDRDVTVAWHVNRLKFEAQAKKRLPSLKSQLVDRGAVSNGGRQTASQIRSALVVMSGMYGIPLRKGGKRVTA